MANNMDDPKTGGNSKVIGVVKKAMTVGHETMSIHGDLQNIIEDERQQRLLTPLTGGG